MAKHHLCLSVALAVMAALPCPKASAQSASPNVGVSANPSANELGEIVVTAQRREQSLETTPVAVSVIGGDSLSRNAIASEQDLQIAVPGLTVKAGQDSNQLNYSLRGQTVDSFSSSQPAVLPYFNEVQVASIGSSAFYDLESVQVLKGPQGTLFGRNSTGGAVLFTSAKPTNEFGGYISETGGNYGLWQTEGAINVPIVDSKLLLRVAGFTERQQGFQYNLYDDQRLGNIRRDNFRVSLTFAPTSGISNELVVDRASAGGTNVSSLVYNVLSPSVNKPGDPYIAANVFYTPAVDALFGAGAYAKFLAANPGAYPGGILAYAALQKARGPFLVDTDATNFHRTNNLVLTDITKIDLTANLQFKNILGYTHLFENDADEFDGTPFPLDSNGTVGRGGWTRQFSEEPQLIGKAFGGTLSYVTGLYFFDERNQTLSLSQIFGLEPFIPVTNQFNDGVTTDKTYAGYGQGTLDLSDIVGLRGLSVTAGGRYSSEKISFLHLPDDVYVASPPPPGAVFVNPLSDTFKKFSWEGGVQEQVNQNLLVYLVSRRSFRSGGFNFFAPPLPGFGNNGGAEYEPETATDVEIGSKFQGNLGNIPMRLNIAAYNMVIDNIQRSNYVSIFGSLAGITVNVPQAKVSGIEIDGVIKPVQWLSLGGSLNATDARFTKDLVSVLGNPAVAFGPYPDTSKWSGDVFAEGTAPVIGNLIASLRGDLYAQTSNYISSTANTLNPGTQIPGYGIANFRVGIEDTGAGWALTANIKNAFNHVYYVGGVGFASLFAVNTVVPGPPRTFALEARYKF
jgi:iron complex outermembrane receptor protein